MDFTLKDVEKLIDKKLGKEGLQIIYDKLLDLSTELSGIRTELSGIRTELSGIKTDLAVIRRDLGYDNLKIIRTDKEEM